MFAYMMKLFWSKFGVILSSILQKVWTQVRLLRSSLISVHSVCLHNEIILEKIIKLYRGNNKQSQCFVKYFLYEVIILIDKNKNNYLIFVNEIETFGFKVGMTH